MGKYVITSAFNSARFVSSPGFDGYQFIRFLVVKQSGEMQIDA